VSGASADKGANASSDSDSSSSSDSDSEDDDTQFAIEGLTPEQQVRLWPGMVLRCVVHISRCSCQKLAQAIVNARVRQLQSNYNSFIERQREQKLTDLMENLGILQREAEVALEFCSGNEVILPLHSYRRPLMMCSGFVCGLFKDGSTDTLVKQPRVRHCCTRLY
jgi:hypothetical protein